MSPGTRCSISPERFSCRRIMSSVYTPKKNVRESVLVMTLNIERNEQTSRGQEGATPDAPVKKHNWYRRYRGSAYLGILGAIAWTAIIALPVVPFSYLPPIIVGGGPGIWFVLAYLLFIVVGVGGFSAISAFLATVELHEGRTIDDRIMWPALILLLIGSWGSCLLLAVAGGVGGYASTYGTATASLTTLLSPYVDPITALVSLALIGAALAILSMAGAK